VSERAAQKRARRHPIVAERAAWSKQLTQLKRMLGWVLEVEHLLDASLAQPGEVVSNATVGSRLDTWRP
jgi:phage terminase small subunit